MKHSRSAAFPLACALSILLLGGCGGSSKTAHVRLLNVSADYNSLDVYDNKNSDQSSDSLLLQSVAYESVSDYASLDPATYAIKFRVHGVSDSLQTLGSESLADESHATYIAFGSSGNFASLKIGEDTGDPDSGKSTVHLYNTAEAGSLDVYLTDSAASLDNASPTFSAVAAGTAGSDASISSGTYRLRVTAAGDKTDLRLDVASIKFDNQKVSSLVLTATKGGVLVNAFYLPQQGSLTAFHNTQSRVRGAVGISDGTAVTLSVGGYTLLSGAAAGVISNAYTQITANAATAVTLSVDGTAVAVDNQSLVAGADYTLLVWSNASGTQTTLVADNNRVPTTSRWQEQDPAAQWDVGSERRGDAGRQFCAGCGSYRSGTGVRSRRGRRRDGLPAGRLQCQHRSKSAFEDLDHVDGD